jgi:hypothetical protein
VIRDIVNSPKVMLMPELIRVRNFGEVVDKCETLPYKKRKQDGWTKEVDRRPENVGEALRMDG